MRPQQQRAIISQSSHVKKCVTFTLLYIKLFKVKIPGPSVGYGELVEYIEQCKASCRVDRKPGGGQSGSEGS